MIDNKIGGHARISLTPAGFREIALRCKLPISYKAHAVYMYWKNITFHAGYDDEMMIAKDACDDDLVAENLVDDRILEQAEEEMESEDYT